MNNPPWGQWRLVCQECGVSADSKGVGWQAHRLSAIYDGEQRPH